MGGVLCGRGIEEEEEEEVVGIWIALFIAVRGDML